MSLPRWESSVAARCPIQYWLRETGCTWSSNRMPRSRGKGLKRPTQQVHIHEINIKFKYYLPEYNKQDTILEFHCDVFYI